MRQIKDEGILKIDRYVNFPNIDRNFIVNAIDYVIKKVDVNLDNYTYKFPSPVSTNNIYTPAENYEWTPGFWTGMLWLAYDVTGDIKYRDAAEIQVDTFKKRLDNHICVDTHDLGFLYSLSCVAAYKLTGNELARDTAIRAADYLINRYHDKAKIIQAWGNLSDQKNQGRMIIDCCMNLPLLYWASQTTGKSIYYDIACNHIKQTAKYLIRDDASSFHTFFMDIEKGEPLHGKTAQGFSDESCWARGQAWAIYGFPLNYLYTHNIELIKINKCLINYFLNRLPEDYICCWDLTFTNGEEVRDSSAAAIAVCGILEMVKHLSIIEENRRIYENAAIMILKSLAENYTSRKCIDSNGILLHGVYSKPSGKGIDECCLWGDYFYFEALVRVYKDWKMYW